MKKLMTLTLGLSFLVGTVSLFAQDTKSGDSSTTTTKKTKKKKSKKGAAGSTDSTTSK